jgi:replicative DNA helicase
MNEKALLSTIITIPEALDELSLVADEFQDHRNQRIFQTLLDLRSAGEVINMFSVIAKNPQLQDYIFEITADAHPAVSVSYFADQIRSAFINRQLLEVASVIISNQTDDPDALIDQVRAKLDSVAQKETESRSLIDLFDQMIDNLDKPPALIDSGMSNLNKVIGGYRNGAMYVVAARPGVGKSLFALESAFRLVNEGHVLFFSLEMDERDLMHRLTASLSSVTADSLSMSQVDPDERKKIMAMRQKFDRNLTIRTTPGLNVNNIRAEFRKASKREPVKAIVVDYLGLMSDTIRTSNRYEKITNISNALKRLALELNVPIIALSQLNREVEGRSNPQPTLSDLRDSGAIEQDADVVMLLFRESINGIYENLMQVLIAKNRHGRQGKISFEIHPAYTRIVERHD